EHDDRLCPASLDGQAPASCHFRMPTCQRIGDGGTLVAQTVVDDDDLDRTVALRQNAPDSRARKRIAAAVTSRAQQAIAYQRSSLSRSFVIT
ncbi:MAG: hypothetical protein M3P29_03770, partial [Acidobacteriota bacterium]|nr:hypothetical protein [Acidobacteriota bacterium]